MYIRAKGKAFVTFRLIYSQTLANIILKQISSFQQLQSINAVRLPGLSISPGQPVL